MARSNTNTKRIRQQVNRDDRRSTRQELHVGNYDAVATKPRPACVKWMAS